MLYHWAKEADAYILTCINLHKSALSVCLYNCPQSRRGQAWQLKTTGGCCPFCKDIHIFFAVRYQLCRYLHHWRNNSAVVWPFYMFPYDVVARTKLRLSSSRYQAIVAYFLSIRWWIHPGHAYRSILGFQMFTIALTYQIHLYTVLYSTVYIQTNLT